MSNRRLHDLQDNLRQAQDLLKRYEDALRLASEPKEQVKYEQEIRRLREEITWSQEEIDALPSDSRAKSDRRKALDIAVSRLPDTGTHLLVGRSEELAQLTRAWNNPQTNSLCIVAPGGVGKTQLVKQWRQGLARKGFGGAERVYDWSFYSQGTRHETASTDDFFDRTLRWFGEPDPTAIRDPWEKGQRLVQLVNQSRTLLILDGLEPLQHPPGPFEGELTDPGLRALVRGLSEQNAGLCVITSREALPELAGVPEPTHVQIDLNTLEPTTGAELLHRYAVNGSQDELEQASRDYKGHALALILLGTYLRDRCGGDILQHNRITWPPGIETAPALDSIRLLEGKERVVRVTLARSWSRMCPGLRTTNTQMTLSRAAVAILRLMGLFNRPADSGCMNALREEPVEGLTEALFVGSERDELWQKAIQRLRDARLLAESVEASPDKRFTSLDAHPLVREHFAAQLAGRFPEAAREAHRSLYEHLKQSTPELPDTLQAMMPLYHAVVHGCAAGLWQDVLDDVFMARIRRRQEAFSLKKLGAFGADLAALTAFFDRAWDAPTARVTEAHQAWILAEVAFCFRALGRLAETDQVMHVALNMRLGQESWTNAAINASNLSQLYLTLGDVSAAVRAAEQSVELADRSSNAFQRMSKLTTLADALHQSAKMSESLAAFCEAEAMQQERQPQYPLLYSLQGFQYCDLLLDAEQDAISDVRNRAETALEWAQQGGLSLLDIGLDHLTLGRTDLLEALLPSESSHQDTRASRAAAMERAEQHLNQSVSFLRQAGVQDYLLRGLLARAALRREQEQFDDAAQDLAEAETVAERSAMLIFQIDAAIERCRLYLAMGDCPAARTSLERAKALIEQTEKPYQPHEPSWPEWKPPSYVNVFTPGDIVGYHRRNLEINALEATLSGME